MNYIKIYEERKSAGQTLLNKYRDEAFARFTEQGVPDRQNEKYRHTALKALFAAQYQYTSAAHSAPGSLKSKLTATLPQLDAHLIYIVNGFVEQPLCTAEAGITLSRLTQASQTTPDTVAKYYNTTTDSHDPLASLNTALAADGLYIKVEAHHIATKPIVIINISTAARHSFTQQRNLFIFDEGSQAQVAILHLDAEGEATLSNDLSEIIVNRNAQIEITQIHNTSPHNAQINSIYGKQEENSALDHINITLAGRLIRNNIEIQLAGARSANHLYGLSIADNRQHIDNHTFVKHTAPECTSNELYKSIVGGRAVNIFNGRIFVQQDAQKTAAYQANRNILLSKEAKIHTKPQLEIYADDVKCTHGATVGQLDRDTLFYMQARGLNKHQAQLLLMSGFAGEVTSKIQIPQLKEYLTDTINQTLSKLYQ